MFPLLHEISRRGSRSALSSGRSEITSELIQEASALVDGMDAALSPVEPKAADGRRVPGERYLLLRKMCIRDSCYPGCASFARCAVPKRRMPGHLFILGGHHMALFKKLKKEKNPEHHMRTQLNISVEGLSDEEAARLEAEAVLEKFDKESAYRNKLTGLPARLIAAILLLFSLFQLYTSVWTCLLYTSGTAFNGSSPLKGEGSPPPVMINSSLARVMPTYSRRRSSARSVSIPSRAKGSASL